MTKKSITVVPQEFMAIAEVNGVITIMENEDGVIFNSPIQSKLAIRDHLEDFNTDDLSEDDNFVILQVTRITKGKLKQGITNVVEWES